jgi:hypothetical protein
MNNLDYEIDKLYLDCGLNGSNSESVDSTDNEAVMPNNRLNTGSFSREPFVYLVSTSDKSNWFNS